MTLEAVDAWTATEDWCCTEYASRARPRFEGVRYLLFALWVRSRRRLP